MVRGRVKESMRLSRNVKRSAKPLVIVYHRYKFTDSLHYLSEVSASFLLHSTVKFNCTINVDSLIISEQSKLWKQLALTVLFYGEHGTTSTQSEHILHNDTRRTHKKNFPFYRDKCIEFYDYLENVLGPIIQSSGRSYSVEEVQSNWLYSITIWDNKTINTEITSSLHLRVGQSILFHAIKWCYVTIILI